MSMLQIGILGVAGVLLALQFKNGKSEYGIYISIVLGLLIFATLLGKISLIKDVLNEINGVAGPGNDYWKTLWKILGITYAAEFSSAICKDAGYQTIALQIESVRQDYDPGVKSSGVKCCFCRRYGDSDRDVVRDIKK